MLKQLTSFAADCARDARSAVALQDEAIAVLKISLIALQHHQAVFSQADWEALPVTVGLVHDTLLHARDATMEIVEGAETCSPVSVAPAGVSSELQRMLDTYEKIRTDARREAAGKTEKQIRAYTCRSVGDVLAIAALADRWFPDDEPDIDARSDLLRAISAFAVATEAR